SPPASSWPVSLGRCDQKGLRSRITICSSWRMSYNMDMDMKNIIRDVRDIDDGDRQAIEHVVGQSLRDDQRLVIQIVSFDSSDEKPGGKQTMPAGRLPEWCNVYEGLSDTEIAELEKSIVRSHESRSLV